MLAALWNIVCTRLDARSRAGRLKQWLNFLRRVYPEAQAAYEQLKTVQDPAVIDAWLMALQADAEPALARPEAPANGTVFESCPC
jgi:tRNA-dihydrouridine synthase C